jgi:hypothetical protein
MAYGDRLTISIKDFGKKVVIEAKRGKIKLDKSERKATINYKDDENRNKKLKK